MLSICLVSINFVSGQSINPTTTATTRASTVTSSPCPAGQYRTSSGCITCPAGFYCPGNSQTGTTIYHGTRLWGNKKKVFQNWKKLQIFEAFLLLTIFAWNMLNVKIAKNSLKRWPVHPDQVRTIWQDWRSASIAPMELLHPLLAPEYCFCLNLFSLQFTNSVVVVWIELYGLSSWFVLSERDSCYTLQ